MSWGCTDELGTIAFETPDENNFSSFIQNIGTFNFKQEYTPNINSSTILTSLKVETTPQVLLEYEIIAFKNDTLSYKNIVFVSSDSILTNHQNFKQLDSQGGYLLDNGKVQTSIFKRYSNDTINRKSGHYEGVSKLITPVEGQEDTFELITLFGNVDYNNQMILYPTTIIEGFDRLEGVYNNANEFSGKVFFNNIETGIISNDPTNFSFNNTTLTDTLFLMINTEVKKIVLTLNKTN